jgi:hypothetical protein
MFHSVYGQNTHDWHRRYLPALLLSTNTRMTSRNFRIWNRKKICLMNLALGNKSLESLCMLATYLDIYSHENKKNDTHKNEIQRNDT